MAHRNAARGLANHARLQAAGTVIDRLEGRRAAVHIALSIPVCSKPREERVGQALRFCLSHLVRRKDVSARPQPSALDFGPRGQQTPIAKGAGLSWVLGPLVRSAVVSWDDPGGIWSMRASSGSSFCVSRHARMMPRLLQIRAPA